MDPISSLTADQANADLSGITGATNTNLNREDFLLLLVTQLSNQDPLNPMDGQEFAAQLAQFSSLEQLININDSIALGSEVNGLLAQSVNSGVASGLIGKRIEAEGNQFYFDGDESAELRFQLERAASQIEIDIFNPAGQKVRTLTMAQLESGDHTLSWDGADADGNELPAGTFTYEVKATDAEGNEVSAKTFLSGRVDRVTFNQDGIFLWIGDTSVSMGDVSSVSEDE